MDNLVWIVYLIGKLDSFLFLCWGSIIVLMFFLVLRSGLLADNISRQSGYSDGSRYYEEYKQKVDYWKAFGFKRFLCPAIVLILLALVTPNESSAYKIMAVYGGVELLQTDEAKKLSSKSLDVLNKVMDEYLDEPKVD